MKQKRVIGTTIEAVRVEEEKLGRKLPESFIQWLLEYNGLNIEGVSIYPVQDKRDLRKTWESLSYNFQKGWADWLKNFNGSGMNFSHLLPFANFGTGDYYCFDYDNLSGSGEPAVVHWSHETGETEFRANDFSDFIRKVKSGEFDSD